MESEDKLRNGDQRSEIMKARLLDATLDVIVKEGWAGASTTKICNQAKVSRGAQTHHFPTKTELTLAAIDRIARQHMTRIVDLKVDNKGKKNTLRKLLSIIWESMNDDRFMYCSMEALVVARTNPELKKLVVDLDTEVLEAMRALADDMVDMPSPINKIKDAIELSVYLFRSLVIERGIHDDLKFKKYLFETWCDFIEKALDID